MANCDYFPKSLYLLRILLKLLRDPTQKVNFYLSCARKYAFFKSIKLYQLFSMHGLQYKQYEDCYDNLGTVSSSCESIHLSSLRCCRL